MGQAARACLVFGLRFHSWAGRPGGKTGLSVKFPFLRVSQQIFCEMLFLEDFPEELFVSRVNSVYLTDNFVCEIDVIQSSHRI